MNTSPSSHPPDPSPTTEPMFHAGLSIDEWSRRLHTLNVWPQGRDGLHHPPPLPQGELLPPLELPVSALIDLQTERLP